MTLKDSVIRGAAYLVLRQGLGIGLSFAGALLLTRLIGPEAYGLYAAATGITTFLALIARMGVDVYLLRRTDDPPLRVYHQAFTFLLVSGVSVSALALAAAPVLGQWLNDDRYLAPVRAGVLLLPAVLLPVPAVVRLERALDYRSVAALETAQQAVLLTVGVVLAWQGWGVWAPLAGYAASLVALAVGGHLLGHYRPRLFWSVELLREMLGYGFGYSASGWIWQSRALVNPLVVGRYAGVEAVGYVALAMRLVDTLSFVWTATWRISIVALARLESDRRRLLVAANDGMGLQVLALGPILAGFAFAGPWAVRLGLGSEWLPALGVYPFIALTAMAGAAFSLHSSALYVLQRNWEMAVFNLVHVGLLTGGALALVPMLGPLGYGWAELLSLASYALLHFTVSRHLGQPAYSVPLAWVVAFTIALFGATLGQWVCIVMPAPLLWPCARRQARGAVGLLLPRILARVDFRS